MSVPFEPRYAEAYDAVYRDKTYESECDLIESVLREHARRPVRRIVDLGCGTGSHALSLARRGYEVIGVDVSPAMLAVARAKAGRDGLGDRLRFVGCDLAQYLDTEPSDAALMMFAVLGYQTTDDALSGALESVARNVAPGGIFAFDVWYLPAVRSIGFESRQKIVETAEGRLRRSARGALDAAGRVCEVVIELAVADAQGNWIERSREVHAVRAFEAAELEHKLAHFGFELLCLTAFPDVKRPPDDSTWNVFGVARAGGASRLGTCA